MTVQNYPLEAGGVDDYPVRAGSMLLTMVDPHRGYEHAYNRWYERDHYYAGCMIGPWLFAGSRWVAPRELKDLRWPKGDAVAKPYDAGSYVAIYWVEAGHHKDHFDDWARPQVFWLYSNGRGFAERRHIHTVLFDHLGDLYRDPDPVPVDLALDARYDGLVIAWMDGRDGRDGRAVHDAVAKELGPTLLAGSTIESLSTWTPSPGEGAERTSPMDLGSPAGGPERACQLMFVRGDVRDVIGRVHAYTEGIERAGIADIRLVAPWFATKVGTDTYVDELW
ncbi:MAG TPA: hypothetical protein VMU14_07445 [Acidimicrobiales bacterium]|nr:hypothetical protein [Acidimicrobiales bacterium]